MYLVDTHTHIYLPEFDSDRIDMMARTREAGVDRLLLPAIDSRTHKAMLAQEKEYTNCMAMMGLHPCSVTAAYAEELAVIEQYLSQRKFIAIGEIGLDFYWDKTFEKEQYIAFRRQVALALEHDIPIVIHSRNATDECIAVVQEFPGVRGVFHCFSGDLQQANKIIEAGLLLGIGGVVTFKNSSLDKVVEQLSMNHLVLETDAPYLAPVPYRGKRNEPAYTKLVAEKLAELYKTGVDEVAKITTQNARSLFNI